MFCFFLLIVFLIFSLTNWKFQKEAWQHCSSLWLLPGPKFLNTLIKRYSWRFSCYHFKLYHAIRGALQTRAAFLPHFDRHVNYNLTPPARLALITAVVEAVVVVAAVAGWWLLPWAGEIGITSSAVGWLHLAAAAEQQLRQLVGLQLVGEQLSMWWWPRALGPCW